MPLSRCRLVPAAAERQPGSDAVVNPLFSDEAFLATRRQIAGQLGQQAQSPALLADEKIGAVAFGSHPYGRSLRGGKGVFYGTVLRTP